MGNTSKEAKIAQLQRLLKYSFGIVVIAAGADKFLNLLTDWEHYLAPSLAKLLPVGPSAFMMLVGVIEILAGVLVFAVTRIGAMLVSAWLLLIALSLLSTWHYPDVAVRDTVMAIGAYVLAKLTELSDTYHIHT